MAKIEDVDNSTLLFSEQASAPATPATGDWRVYFKSDGLYVVDDAGSETGPLSTGGGATSFVGVKATRSAAYSMASGTPTAYPFDAESFDTDTFHDTGTNPSRLTIPSGKAGKYLVGGCAGISNLSASATRFFIDLRVNGTLATGSRLQHDGLSTGHDPVGQCSTILDLSVGDYVELFYFHDTGSSETADTNNAAIWAHYLG